MQGKVKLPVVHITLVQDLKSIGELARDLPLGSFYDEKERKAVVPVPALGPSVSVCLFNGKVQVTNALCWQCHSWAGGGGFSRGCAVYSLQD